MAGCAVDSSLRALLYCRNDCADNILPFTNRDTLYTSTTTIPQHDCSFPFVILIFLEHGMHRQFKPKKIGVPLRNFASHLRTITQLHSFDFLFFCDPHFKHLDWTGWARLAMSRY